MGFYLYRLKMTPCKSFGKCYGFPHRRGIVLGLKVMENKKPSEIKTVQELLETLDLKGYVLTLDALHCQKNIQ